MNGTTKKKSLFRRCLRCGWKDLPARICRKKRIWSHAINETIRL